MARLVRLLALALLSLAPVVASGQPINGMRPALPHGRIPLTVVLVRALPHPGASFEIQRRTAGLVQDVLILLDTVTPEEFSEGIRGVLTARLVGGDPATHPATLRVHPARAGAQRRAFPWAASDARLRPRSAPAAGADR
jgi:hypothetical protein